MNPLDYIVNLLLLSRIPILNGHTVTWIVLLALSWLATAKIVPQKSDVVKRLVAAFVSLFFFIGLGEITFDPFWVVACRLTLETYALDIFYSPWLYAGLVMAVVFFKLKRPWLLLIPITVNYCWFLSGFHAPLQICPVGPVYPFDLVGHLFDIAGQIVAFIAGYFMIAGFKR